MVRLSSKRLPNEFLSGSHVLIRFKPVALIILATVLAVVATGLGELVGTGTSGERTEDSTPDGEIRSVVFPIQESTRTDRGTVQRVSLPPTYVGRKVCAECHKENFDLHAKHGHASTLFNCSDTDIPEIFAGKHFDAGGDFGVYSYQRDEQGELTVELSDSKQSDSMRLQYVLGSGFNAQTFLTLRTDPDGKTEGIEHRVSCYRDDRLGVTVGHEIDSPASEEEKFGHLIKGETLERCVYCHTTTARVDGGKIQNLIANVNCEKCHGAGSEHVHFARQSTNPPPYSVGKDTWDSESEIQLCGDCHRLPRSVSKGELRDYPDSLARFQPVGLLRSRCYLESNFSLRCSTCHNPHATNHGSDGKADHVKNCISCHDQTETSHVICPVSPKTNCIECHMPALEQQQGIRFHDHWIRVREK